MYDVLENEEYDRDGHSGPTKGSEVSVKHGPSAGSSSG